MLVIPYVYIVAVYTAIYLLVRAAVSLRNKKIDWKRERLHILMYINLIVIIYFTFSPLCLDLNEIFNCRINLIPFVYLLDYDSGAHMIYNVFGNIFEILQLPFADRASDVDDLIMNTLGVATGYVIYMIVRYAKNPGKQKANLPGVLKQR